MLSLVEQGRASPLDRLADRHRQCARHRHVGPGLDRGGARTGWCARRRADRETAKQVVRRLLRADRGGASPSLSTSTSRIPAAPNGRSRTRASSTASSSRPAHRRGRRDEPPARGGRSHRLRFAAPAQDLEPWRPEGPHLCSTWTGAEGSRRAAGTPGPPALWDRLTRRATRPQDVPLETRPKKSGTADHELASLDDPIDVSTLPSSAPGTLEAVIVTAAARRRGPARGPLRGAPSPRLVLRPRPRRGLTQPAQPNFLSPATRSA
jgi:hypothetical protein